MSSMTVQAGRAFKTAWFSRAARKVRISDADLCEAIQQAMAGQADDLGGGVFKKRLNKNMHRSIIVAKGGRFWVFVYLFAKSDRANIGSGELDAFRDLADFYSGKSEADLVKDLRAQELLEICRDDQTQVQERRL